MPWLLVGLCVVLAIAFPLITRWRATPEMLREQFRTWRPGWVPALAAVGIAWVAVLLVAAVATAVAHSWAWAAVAMTASALGSFMLYLARYRRIAILERRRLRAELEGSDGDVQSR